MKPKLWIWCGVIIILVLLLPIVSAECAGTKAAGDICPQGKFKDGSTEKDAYAKYVTIDSGLVIRWYSDSKATAVLPSGTILNEGNAYYTIGNNDGTAFGQTSSGYTQEELLSAYNSGTKLDVPKPIEKGTPIIPPVKGAAVLQEKIFILYLNNQEITLKYNSDENEWLFSHSCGIGILFSKKNEFLVSTAQQCSFEEPNIIEFTQFPDTLGFEAGVTSICKIFAINGENSKLFFNGEEIIPLISKLWTLEQLTKEKNQFCLDKVFAAEKGETLAFLTENPPEESKGSGEETETAAQSVSDCKECKEIDLVWLDIGKILQISSAISEKVWSGSQWILFALAYPTETISSQIKPSPTAYDQFIIKYSKENYVTPSIIKAIVEHESGFTPNAISATGCSGLMQICGSSAQPDYIKTQCKQNRNIGPQKCGACNSWKDNLNWCLPCSGSNCQEDDRFNPEKNIASGAKLFKNHLDNCKGDLTCGLNNYGGVSVGGAKSTYPLVIIKNSQKFTNLDSQ